ncbi:MAG: hypothetical protein NTZ24_11565 [Deltaproteobacteria bacterium]|nr:hypothetical protein [Deltaproteobacteria bacterium]
MVRAIDRQESILQSNMTERIQQVQQQHSDMQQRYFDIQLSQERRKMLQKVKESEEAERAHPKEKEGKKHRKDQQKKNETLMASLPEDTSDNQDERSHIDIKV